jgi:hypothetical protein
VTALLGAGCVYYETPVVPPQGFLATSISAPLTPEIADVPVSDRRGSASTLFIRDIFFTGGGIALEDASIQAAARNGNLSKVHYADYELLTVLGVFGEFTVHAYGE